jgi:hypothetical protein
MIQRKQTVFLLLALLALIACLCLPIGAVEPKGMGVSTVWYNAGLATGQGFQVHPILFVDLVLTGALSLTAIFLYRRRQMQAHLCTAGVVLCVVWYAFYAAVVYTGRILPEGTFHPQFAVCLPLVAIILLLMARRGIMADEKLVRSMDRIR